MIRSRALPVLLGLALVACSADKRTGPEDPLASQLTAIADSSEFEDFRVAAALYSASVMVRAGGQVSHVSIVVDSQPRTFKAVGIRVSYSPKACEQLRNLFNEGYLLTENMSGDVGDSALFMPYDPCQAYQSIIAWEGDDLSRIAWVQGDTGSNTMAPDSYDFDFFAELYDRTTGKEWLSMSGTSMSGLVARGTACRDTAREEGVTFNCRLVTLSQSFDLVLQEWPEFDFDSTIVPIRPTAARSLTARETAVVFATTVVADTIYADSGYTWQMGPTHTMAMRRHVINGLAMEVTGFDFERGLGRSMAAAQSARIRRSRTR